LTQINVKRDSFWTPETGDFHWLMNKFQWLGRAATGFCLLLAVVACGRAPQSPNAAVRHYDCRGIVRGFAPDRSTVEIEHEAIPGWMPAMTMPFTPRDRKEIASLQRGDAISFRIDVTDNEVLIADLKKIAASEVRILANTTTPPPIASASDRLREGDTMRPFHLTNEAGEPVNAQTYRGRPWVLTFIFTRCPMPNFCPLMGKNFSELQKAIKSGAGALAETRLLSITIDPQFDTPAILRQYAEAEGADPKIWNFATAEPAEIDALTKGFAVYRQNEGGTISHGLTTALIDREGKIAGLWRGNSWKPQEIVEAIAALP
jgi:protein SCO1/2